MYPNIEINIDVAGNPEMQALAAEGDAGGIIATCAAQLGCTEQMVMHELLEGGELRSGIPQAWKEAGPCRCVKLGAAELQAYINSIKL
jgi:hypothetical protein